MFVLKFPYAAANQLKQLNTCMGFVIFISIIQTDLTALLCCFYPWGKQNQPYNSRPRFVTWCISISCCTDYGWIFTPTVIGAMQNNGKRDTASNTASQNFMVDLVTQLLLILLKLLLSWCGREWVRSCLHISSPSLPAKGMQARKEWADNGNIYNQSQN